MVVGGGEIYRQTIARADRLEITHVDVDVDGDTVFPEIDPRLWRRIVREEGDGYRFVTYERRRGGTGTDDRLRDLTMLQASIEPHLHAGEYAFCSVPVGSVPNGLHPVATIVEREGTTLVLPVEEAADAGLAGDIGWAWITLGVRSALDAVGLTAAVATALAGHDISCNVIAGYHHDHLFVPVEAATRAMAALVGLSNPRG